MKRTVAIAGLGVAGRTIHLPALAKVAGLEVAGGFDPAARAADFPFPLFGSVAAMLEAVRPALLVIASPPDRHVEQAKQGLEAGCHVLCEKPFTATLEEADALAALARQRDRWLVVNQEFRFMETNLAVKRAIGRAGFGELRFVSAFQSFPVKPGSEPGWRSEGNQRTCREFGIHVLDLCRYFFGEEPERIHARMPRGADPQGPDYLNLIELEFPGGRAAHITLDRLARGPHRYLDLRIDGSEGTIETSLGGRLALNAGLSAATKRPFLDLDIAQGGRARLYNGERFTTLATEPSGIFAHATAGLLRAFMEAIDRGGEPPCHAADARRSLALVQAAYDSDAKGVPLVLREGRWTA